MSKVSSLRFRACIDSAMRESSCPIMEFGGFSNAVMEQVFQVPLEARGLIEHVVYSEPSESRKGVFDRLARVSTKKGDKRYFFYVFGEKDSSNFHGWRIAGISRALQGKIRMPDYETEMLWFE